MITIGLLTNDVTSGNFGVNALSISNLLFLEEICRENNIPHNYIIFDNPQKKVQYADILNKIEGLEDMDFSLEQALELRKPLKTLSSFNKNIKKCNIVFDTSGGDSFADIYGNTRIIHQLLPKIITNKNRVPLVFTPQTIGPFNRRLWKTIAKRLSKQSYKIFVRDNLSFNYCANELKLNNVIEVTDMAMRLPYETSFEHTTQHKLRIGINVSGLLYNGGYNQSNQFGLKSPYNETIRALIVLLKNSYDCEIHFVPHVISNSVEGDNIVCDQLKKEFPDVIYEGPFDGPIEAKSYIAKMDVFIGSRMHSTIAALSSGVPTIPLSYSRKFEGLFSSLEYNECINLKKLDSDRVVQIIKEKIDGLEELKVSTDNVRLEIQRKLHVYRNSLSGVLIAVNNN